MNLVLQNHPRSILIVLLVLCVFGVFQMVHAQKPKGRDSLTSKQSYVTISGPHSSIRKADSQRISSLRDWTNLWLRHKGLPIDKHYDIYKNAAGLPIVDFSSCMVIAVFDGATVNSWGYKTVSVTESAQQITLRIESKGYGSAPNEEGRRVTPYAFFVLPRSSKPLVVEIAVFDKRFPEKKKWEPIAQFKKIAS